MFRYSIVFLCVVLVSNVEFIKAGRLSGGGGSRHSYPKSSGHSGGSSYSHSSGGSHAYPPSSGYSGNGGRGGGYPGGGGSHTYPNSGGSHTYPNSGGSHTYPSSGGNSGSHNYPNSPGLSGTNNHGIGGRGNQGTTNVHHHYHYNPPQQIHYTSPHGGHAMNYPVYRGTPPTYVYQYKDSGSKYGTLLAGLALFNLGALAGGAIGYSQGHSHSNNQYRPEPNEVCLFGVKKDNGDFEETRIECQLISSFIYAEQNKQKNQQNATTTNTVVTTVTNQTIVNASNAQDTPVYVLSPNGTLVPPASITTDAGNATNGAPVAGGTVMSSVVVTTTNTTTVNAVDVKGPAIQVTPGMQCYVMRRTPYSRMKHEVPCGLLQTYADKSLKRNSASRNVPAFTILAVVCAVFVNNY